MFILTSLPSFISCILGVLHSFIFRRKYGVEYCTSDVYTEALLGSLTCFSILTACYKARTRSAREQYYGGNTTTSTTQKTKIIKILPTRRVTRVRTWVFPIRFKWSQDRDSANRFMVVVRSTTRPRLVTCCQNRKTCTSDVDTNI